jgi:hypothetical protein
LPNLSPVACHLALLCGGHREVGVALQRLAGVRKDEGKLAIVKGRIALGFLRPTPGQARLSAWAQNSSKKSKTETRAFTSHPGTLSFSEND